MKNRDFEFPSVDELYALEQAARRERAREMAKLLRRAFDSLARAFDLKGHKGLRHA